MPKEGLEESCATASMVAQLMVEIWWETGGVLTDAHAMSMRVLRTNEGKRRH